MNDVFSFSRANCKYVVLWASFGEAYASMSNIFTKNMEQVHRHLERRATQDSTELRGGYIKRDLHKQCLWLNSTKY